MEKKYISIILFSAAHSLLFSAEKKWLNKKEFQVTVEKLIKKCINHERRLLQEGKSHEEAGELVFKTHDSCKLMKLRKKNPHFEEVIQVVFKKVQESS